MLQSLTIGAITTLPDAAKALRDVEQWANGLFIQLKSIATKPGASTLAFLVEEDTGLIEQWTLVAGAGVTLNFNTSTRVCTITSP